MESSLASAAALFWLVDDRVRVRPTGEAAFVGVLGIDSMGGRGGTMSIRSKGLCPLREGVEEYILSSSADEISSADSPGIDSDRLCPLTMVAVEPVDACRAGAFFNTPFSTAYGSYFDDTPPLEPLRPCRRTG